MTTTNKDAATEIAALRSQRDEQAQCADRLLDHGLRLCDDIDALRARVAELEKALEEIDFMDNPDLTEADLRQHDRSAGWANGIRQCAKLARAALGKATS